MLIQLKNKQRKIASVTLSLFMGSWLLLLCQACLAVDEVNNHVETPIETTNSCHPSTTDNVTDEEEALNNEHCETSCDCDAVTINVSNVKNSELKEKIKFSLDLYAYLPSNLRLSIRAPPAYHRISSNPERAILLPLQNYTVLLI
jgi:hypothetical protein